MKTLGIIGGIGPESTIQYYRQILSSYRQRKQDGSYPLIIINSIDMKKMLDFITKSKFLPLVKYLVPFPGTSLYQYAIQSGKIKDTIEFLEMLSKRKVSDYDDEIINLTDLKEETLRQYFHRIWEITKEREPCVDYQRTFSTHKPG